jgi:hypothetical protein
LACGDSETELSPRGDRDAGADAKPGDGGADASDAGIGTPASATRTIIYRQPFGNVAASDNHLWDGDFEWHTPFASQYAWIDAVLMLSQVGAIDGVVVGARCKSGLKCALITQNQKIAGVGVSPGAAPVEASVWGKPPGGDCSLLGAKLITCDFIGDPDVVLADEDNSADAEGWCHYRSISEPREQATCMFIEAKFPEGEAIVDDAVVRAAAADAVLSAAADVPSAQDVESVENARRAIRSYLRRLPDPPKARVQLERWLKRRR